MTRYLADPMQPQVGRRREVPTEIFGGSGQKQVGEWKMAREDDNPTRAKIAFGRLRTLRSCLERKIPEVEAFDEYVEKGRNRA